MELNEMEKWMLYQTEGCERYAVINELSMASQYVGNGEYHCFNTRLCAPVSVPS